MSVKYIKIGDLYNIYKNKISIYSMLRKYKQKKKKRIVVI